MDSLTSMSVSATGLADKFCGNLMSILDFPHSKSIQFRVEIFNDFQSFDRMKRRSFTQKKTLCRGKHLHFVVRDGWEYVDRPAISGIVVIVAKTTDGKLLLVEQYRPPVAAKVIELPAGLAGDVRGAETEELIEAAKRELLEETGYVAARWQVLFAGPPSAGVSSEVVTFLAARRLRRVGKGGGEGNERIKVHEVPLSAIDSWLRKRYKRGVLIDAKVYAGIHFARG